MRALWSGALSWACCGRAKATRRAKDAQPEPGICSASGGLTIGLRLPPFRSSTAATHPAWLARMVAVSNLHVNNRPSGARPALGGIHHSNSARLRGGEFRPKSGSPAMVLPHRNRRRRSAAAARVSLRNAVPQIAARPWRCRHLAVSLPTRIRLHAAHFRGTIMKLPRRRFLRLAGAAAALPALSGSAWTQSYPAQPVPRIIVGFPPGGGVDITGRLLAQALSERLWQSFFIENRPGAGSNSGHRNGRARATRRLHPPAFRRATRHQRDDALRQARLQFHPRHRPGRGRRAAAPCHGGQCGVSRQDAGRAHHLCQGQSGQDQHSFVRGRHDLPGRPPRCS